MPTAPSACKSPTPRGESFRPTDPVPPPARPPHPRGSRFGDVTWARKNRAQADYVALNSHGARRGGPCRAELALRKPGPAPSPARETDVNERTDAGARTRTGRTQEGYSAGSWRRSPWTIHVRLDHGGPTVVLEGETRISTPGARRRRAPRSARSSGNRRDRHLTREHVTLADVLAG